MLNYEASILKRIWLLKGLILKCYLLIHGCKVGKKLKCKQFPIFRTIPKRNSIEIGDFVSIGYRITLEPIGKIILKDHVQLTQDILISASSKVELQEYVGIAEFVSIRDSDHGVRKGIIPHFQPSTSTPILLKKGVGIGRGSVVFRGAKIEEHAIIGAHCIVMRNFESIPNGIYFGNPIRLIGKRF